MALSPMMRHFLTIKEDYKDCILFYRLGDFYEMFFDDAIKASELLDLTLTGRDCGLEERAPMCGIPFKAAEQYISKLISLGEKVAICEQLTEPNGKGLVEREVIRIATPGTNINNEFIDEKHNNFIGAVYVNKNQVSYSWADITTGEFKTTYFEDKNSFSKLVDVLIKTSPVEIIANQSACDTFRDLPLIKHGMLPKFNNYLESQFSYRNAEKTLLSQLNVLTLAPYNLEGKEIAISSAGALVAYLKETQKHALININSITLECDNEFMMLDANAIKNLELVSTLKDSKKYGSLLWVLDKTKTSMGARKLASWIVSPLLDKEKINYRLNAVEKFYENNYSRQTLLEIISCVKDISRISGRISNGNLNPKDCVALKKSLEILPALRFTLSGIDSEFVSDIIANLCEFGDIVEMLSNAFDENIELPSIKDGGYIKKGYSEKLDEVRNFCNNGKVLIAELENREREATGVKTLRISYNRVFGYFIELTKSVKHLAPYTYERVQTLAGAERYKTEELRELEVKILSSNEEAFNLESKLYQDIKNKLSDKIVDLQKTSNAISDLDVLLSLAEVAKQNAFVKPEILSAGQPLEIISGRHPVVEQISKTKFVANDTMLDNNENRTMILTGPNMAGKSTYMRQTALITLLAHIGSFVPAKSAKIPLTDKIFTRVGASDNLILDKSTFMVEMTELSSILQNATKNSLLILDEIGRGTSTYDGLSLAWAVVEYINENIQAKTMFATHYHELTELEDIIIGVKNYKIMVKESEGGILFLRKIMRGSANKSFGIEVASLAGIPEEITKKAKNILKKLENSDITRKEINAINDNGATKNILSETEKIIKDLDVDNLTPMQALNLLLELKDGLKD